ARCILARLRREGAGNWRAPIDPLPRAVPEVGGLGGNPKTSLSTSLERPDPSGSMSMAGRILMNRGLRVGMQAHIMPTLTSTALHISDSDALKANSRWPPNRESGSCDT